MTNANKPPHKDPIMDSDMAIQQAITALADAKRICLLTGAGISAESGIPTFRDKQTGLWENFKAEELANVNAFRRDPQTVWSWYQWRRELVKDKRPNDAHHAVARWQQAVKQQNISQKNQTLTLITQNVDDLHEQAGSEAVYHLHGHLWQNRCSECDTPYDKPLDYSDNTLKHCDECGGIIRPDIVWFGEGLPQKEWFVAESAAGTCDVFVSIGTSSLVHPAAGLGSLAKQSGAMVIEINPNPTNNPMVDIQIAMTAGKALPSMVNVLIG